MRSEQKSYLDNLGVESLHTHKKTKKMKNSKGREQISLHKN